MDIWRNLPSSDIQRLYKARNYPDNPNQQKTLSTFDYKGLGDIYGARLSAVYQVHNRLHCSFTGSLDRISESCADDKIEKSLEERES